jgi:pyruvate,orthophosphate dikinase
VSALQLLVAEYKAIAAVPDDPWEQLRMAVEAAFSAWPGPKVTAYREARDIPAGTGCAITIQSMVGG